MRFLIGSFGFFVGLCILYYLFSTALSAAGTLCLIASAVLLFFKKRGRFNSNTKIPIVLLVCGIVLLPIGIKHRLTIDDAESLRAAKEAKLDKDKRDALDSLVKSRCGNYPFVPKDMMNVAHAVQDYNNSVGVYTNSADRLDDAITKRKQQYSECEDRVRNEKK